MKATIEVTLKPFSIPNFVLLETSLSNAEDKSIPLEQLDGDTLDRLCNEFRAAVFKKAGKHEPPTDKPACRECERRREEARLAFSR